MTFEPLLVILSWNEIEILWWDVERLFSHGQPSSSLVSWNVIGSWRMRATGGEHQGELSGNRWLRIPTCPGRMFGLFHGKINYISRIRLVRDVNLWWADGKLAAMMVLCYMYTRHAWCFQEHTECRFLYTLLAYGVLTGQAGSNREGLLLVLFFYCLLALVCHLQSKEGWC